MGTKVSRIIVREASSGSQYGGTSCRIKSGRTESSVMVQGWLAYDAYQIRKASSKKNLPSRVKLKSGGKSLPFGILAPSSLSS